jgi:energy-coupling factor transport system ATP-binding protein
VLRVEGLTFAHTRGQPILQDIHLTLRARESLALVGANGSGKTTLIKHFNGLHRPQSGRVWVLGQDTRRTRVSRLARQVGMVFQNANDQFFRFTVRDEIEAGARALRCLDPAWLDDLIGLLDLAPLLDRSPYRLSEGEKKRVAFCSALAARPEILVLDEPTTGQDWGFRQALGRLLRELRDLHGLRAGAQTAQAVQTVVLVTHDLEFAEGCAERWALMSEGALLANGTPEVVMADADALHRAGLEATQAFRLHRALEALARKESRAI